MSIGLLVDSTCDLSSEIIAANNIEIIPLSIHFGEKIFLDREEISSEDFFAKLGDVEQLPTTSQPSIGSFVKKYEEMAKKYDKIISIHISGKLSGTVEAAQLAARQLNRLDINVIDSRSTSLGLGFLALYTADLIHKGLEYEEIINRVKEARNNISIYFTVNDLHYLEKGGRIGKAQAFLGSILNVYPILTLPGESGEILPFEKVRGKNKIKKRLIELALKEIDGENNALVGLIHGTNMKVFNSFQDLLNEKLDEIDAFKYNLYKNWISPVLGCHVGPSVYGFVIIKGDFLKL